MKFSDLISKHFLLFTITAIALAIGLTACEKDEDLAPNLLETSLEKDPGLATEDFGEDLLDEDHISYIVDDLRENGYTEEEIEKFKQNMLVNDEVLEADLVDLTEKTTPETQAKQLSGNFRFDSETFRQDLVNHFQFTEEDIPVTVIDMQDLGIIDERVVQGFKRNNIVTHENKKFTQFASNVWGGHHKNSDGFRRTLAASMLLKDEEGRDKHLKLWQDDPKWGNSVQGNDHHLYWDIKSLEDFSVKTKSVLAYASLETFPTEVPNIVPAIKNNESFSRSIKDILGINDNKWTTISVAEGWSKSRTNSHQVGGGYTFGYETKLGNPIVGEVTMSHEFNINYSFTTSGEKTNSWAVDTEIPFFAPNINVPPGYSFRLHPVMGYDVTTIDYDLKGTITGQMTTYNRTGRRTSSNHRRIDNKLSFIPGYTDAWNDGWNSGVQYPSNSPAEYASSKQSFEVYDSELSDARTGIEIYNGTYNDESKILYRQDVPFKANINRLFLHANQTVPSGDKIIYPDAKRMGVAGENGIVRFKFHNHINVFDHFNGSTMIYVSFVDTNGSKALFEIKNPNDSNHVEIALNNPLWIMPGFSRNNVKKMQFHTPGSQNIEFSAYLL